MRPKPRQLGRKFGLEKMLAVILQFFDGLKDIVQRAVAALLYKPIRKPRSPANRQLFNAADVQIPVMEESLESGHVLRKEPPILADAVPA